MPFSKAVKAQMFIKCARICCLCLKQCGINMEAAHIKAEHDGGPNTEDNGIPVCMDCHTEMSHYNSLEPKGNKYTPKELSARRDQLYTLVGSGVLQAMIITGKVHTQMVSGGKPSLPFGPAESKPSIEASNVLDAARKGKIRGEALPKKLMLLNQQDQAYVLDVLLDRYQDGDNLRSLVAILEAGVLNKERTLVIAEQLLRRVTLTNDHAPKGEFMTRFPVELLNETDEGLRDAFFSEIIGIMNGDRYEEVNQITPAAIRVQGAIPPDLYFKYAIALLEQAGSSAWHGAPAAQDAIAELPTEIAKAAFERFDLERPTGKARQALKKLLERTRDAWPKSKRAMFEDFLTLDRYAFRDKYYPME